MTNSAAFGASAKEAVLGHKEAVLLFSPELPSRVVNNLACCLAGLRLVEKFALAQGFAWTDIFPFRLDMCHKYLELAAKEYLLDGGVTNRGILEEYTYIYIHMSIFYRPVLLVKGGTAYDGAAIPQPGKGYKNLSDKVLL